MAKLFIAHGQLCVLRHVGLAFFILAYRVDRIQLFLWNQNTRNLGGRTAKVFLLLGIFVNLGSLGFFKYFNFFLLNLVSLFKLFGLSISPMTLEIILPLGISFYTFKILSYLIDIYRKEIPPTENFFNFALYVAFFPQLIAGPIDRAKRLLPQIQNARPLSLDLFYEGAHLIFWGLFLKIFVGDNLAKIVSPIFALSASPTGAEILMASYAFGFQVFCDFEGYSSIARGLGEMMGFVIMINFQLPFFVTNPQDYWNNWHISLSSWVRDYIYFPVFVSLKNIRGNDRVYIAIMIAMTLMGLWHGAAWNFILWGIYNGCVLLIYTIFRVKAFRWIQINPKKHVIERIWFWFRVFVMFQVTAGGMLIFRSANLVQVSTLIKTLVTNFQWNTNATELTLKLFGFIAPLLIVQIGQFLTNDLLFLFKRHWVLKTLAYAFMSYLLLGWGVMTAERFIYFQF